MTHLYLIICIIVIIANALPIAVCLVIAKSSRKEIKNNPYKSILRAVAYGLFAAVLSTFTYCTTSSFIDGLCGSSGALSIIINSIWYALCCVMALAWATNLLYYTAREQGRKPNDITSAVIISIGFCLSRIIFSIATDLTGSHTYNLLTSTLDNGFYILVSMLMGYYIGVYHTRPTAWRRAAVWIVPTVCFSVIILATDYIFQSSKIETLGQLIIQTVAILTVYLVTTLLAMPLLILLAFRKFEKFQHKMLIQDYENELENKRHSDIE